MADISMCLNENCKIKSDCYRYTAKPNPWRQSYSKFDSKNGEKCVHFIKIRKEKNER